MNLLREMVGSYWIRVLKGLESQAGERIVDIRKEFLIEHRYARKEIHDLLRKAGRSPLSRVEEDELIVEAMSLTEERISKMDCSQCMYWWTRTRECSIDATSDLLRCLVMSESR